MLSAVHAGSTVARPRWCADESAMTSVGRLDSGVRTLGSLASGEERVSAGVSSPQPKLARQWERIGSLAAAENETPPALDG